MSVLRKCLALKNQSLNAKTLSKAFFARNSSSENILQSNLPDIEIPRVSIDEFVLSNCDKYQQLTATECGVTGRKYTYEDLRIQIRNLNRSLRKKLKLEKGDVLAILLPNSPEFALVALSAIKAGLIVTTINPIYTPAEISRQLIDSSTKVIVTFNELVPLAKTSADLAKTKIPILAIKTQEGSATPQGALNFSEFTENIDFKDLPPADYEEIAFLPYSSGTTGLAKGVKLSHKNIVANLLQFSNHQIAVIQDTTKEHQDILPTVLPQFHIYGLVSNTLNLIYKGCKSVTLPKFTPDLYTNVLRIHKPDVLFVAPPLILFLASHPMVKAEDLSSVRTIISGGAPLGALDEDRFLQKAQKPINVYQGYGLTETSPLVSMTRIEDVTSRNSNGSIGQIVSSTLAKIVDPNDPKHTPLGPNQDGELLIKGPQVMKEYHNRPEATKNAFTDDGWFKTGDIMCYNERKMLFVKDRLKELIKVKGFQVPPAELEEIIRDFANVEDAAVIGIPHEKHGEVPRAYIVAKKGKSVDVEELHGFVNSKVASYKKLAGGVVVTEAIPKNASGKILRRVLKENYAEEKK